MGNLVFVSWASPDEAIVKQLVARLKDLGLDPPEGAGDLPRIWEYREEMSAGDHIPDVVAQAIDDAVIAILCLSDEALARTWIRTELDWCAKELKTGKLKHLIPIKVGPLSADQLAKLEHLLPGAQTFLADLSGGWAEEALVRIANDIWKKLGSSAPRLLPVAAYAMTAAQADQLLQGWRDLQKAGQHEPLWDVCRAVGMEKPPELFDALKGRYGDKPEDMMPFQSAHRLVDIIHAAIQQVNLAKAKAGLRPILPRWLHEELSGDGPQWQRARDIWRSGDSLLIVDSVSALCPQIREQLQNLPKSEDPRRGALLWLPPYTRHTVTLEDSLRQAALKGRLGLLSDFLSDWEEKPDRTIAFDTSTSIALRLWLRRTFAAVPDEDVALESNRNDMPRSSVKGNLLRQLSGPRR